MKIYDYGKHIFVEKPHGIVACGKSHVSNLENIAFITVFFNNNIIAHLNVNWLSPVKIRHTLSDGTGICETNANAEAWHKRNINFLFNIKDRTDMDLDLKIVNPVTYKQWDNIVSSFPESSFFHTSFWSKVLNTSYGYKPSCFIFTKNLRPVAVVPFMEVTNPLKGKRGISLPFSDFCEPLFEKDLEFFSIFNKISEYGKQNGWRTLTFSSYYKKGDFPVSHYYYLHKLILQKDYKSILKSFRNSNIRNIKKAFKSDIEIIYSKSLRSIKRFYTLQCITRKKHGLPPQPFEFFKQIYENILKKNNGIVILAQYKNNIISGAVFFAYQDKALYKFGASKTEYQHLRPNNLVLWKGIQYFCECGCKEFSFGKTEPDNEGLLQYKNGFNTERKKLYVYKYHLRKNHFIEEKSKVYGIHNRIFQKTPVTMLQIVGSALYKYVG